MMNAALHTWTLANVMALMEELYPAKTAEEWDKVGLILGDPHAPVRSILLALDPTIATANEAAQGSFDLLVTHHPLLLRGASFLPENDPKGAVITRLIRSRTALFNAHTNADVAQGGVADALAMRLGLRHTRPLIPTGTNSAGIPIGLGRIGDITPTTLGDFADRVAQVLPASPTGLLIGGNEDRTVSRIAVLGGAGDSALIDARQAGADVYVTADLRHHPALEHLEGGAPALLAASHWATESPWLALLAQQLRAAAHAQNVELRVEISTISTEPWVSHRTTTGEIA